MEITKTLRPDLLLRLTLRCNLQNNFPLRWSLGQLPNLDFPTATLFTPKLHPLGNVFKAEKFWVFNPWVYQRNPKFTFRQDRIFIQRKKWMKKFFEIPKKFSRESHFFTKIFTKFFTNFLASFLPRLLPSFLPRFLPSLLPCMAMCSKCWERPFW